MKRETLLLTGAGISMVVAGGATGVLAYFLLKKQLETKYDLIAQEEIAKAKEFYRVLNKEGKLGNPKNVRVESIIEEEQYVPEVEVVVFDIDDEAKERTEEFPYVISHDEYMTGEKDYLQSRFVYFENDDVLLDENDDPIEDTDRVVGDKNLMKFGYGSGDNHIVYVRNDNLSCDFEIVLNKGSYVKEVLGFVEHSEPRGRPRKFRRDDE